MRSVDVPLLEVVVVGVDALTGEAAANVARELKAIAVKMLTTEEIHGMVGVPSSRCISCKVSLLIILLLDLRKVCRVQSSLHGAFASFKQSCVFFLASQPALKMSKPPCAFSQMLSGMGPSQGLAWYFGEVLNATCRQLRNVSIAIRASRYGNADFYFSTS